MAEQRTCNAQVVGLIPIDGSKQTFKIMKTARDLLLGDPIYVVHVTGGELVSCEKATIVRIRHKRDRRLKIIASDEYNDVAFYNATEQTAIINPWTFYIRAFSLDVIYDKYSTWPGKMLPLNEFKKQLLQKLESNSNLSITVQNILQGGTAIPISGGIMAQINEYCPYSTDFNDLTGTSL